MYRVVCGCADVALIETSSHKSSTDASEPCDTVSVAAKSKAALLWHLARLFMSRPVEQRRIKRLWHLRHAAELTLTTSASRASAAFCFCAWPSADGHGMCSIIGSLLPASLIRTLCDHYALESPALQRWAFVGQCSCLTDREKGKAKCNTQVNENDTKTSQSRWQNTHSCGMKHFLGAENLRYPSLKSGQLLRASQSI